MTLPLQQPEKELESDRDKEIQLYLNSPEFHPEYEKKYEIFTEKYNKDFPDQHDIKRREKVWFLFWEEVITCQLRKEYDEKKATLEKEYSRKKKHENSQPRKDDRPQQNSKDRLKRRSSSGKDSDRFEKYHKVNDDGTNRSLQEDGNEIEFKLHRNKDENVHGNEKEFKPNRSKYENLDKPLKIPDGAGGEFTLQETVSLLNDIAPYIGILSAACEVLCEKIRDSWSDRSKLCKLFEDEDCRFVMKNVIDKVRELSGQAEPGIYSRKLKLAGLQGSWLLNFVSLDEDPKYFGLNVEEIAKFTYDMDPSAIIQVVKNALTSRGIVNPSEVKVTLVYEAISSVHVNMALESEEKSHPGYEEQAPVEKVANWNVDDIGDVRTSQVWLTGELDDLIKNLGKSKPSGSSLRDDRLLHKRGW